MTRWTAAVLLSAACAAACGPAVTVRIDAPVDGAVVGGILEVKVSLVGAATKVELVAGDVVLAAADVKAGVAQAVVAWDTTSRAEGELQLLARARDGEAAFDSAPVNVRVHHGAPVAALLVPRLSVVKGTATLGVSVEEPYPGRAWLFEGEQFLADVEGTDVAWDTTQVEDGVHRLHLAVRDAAGNETLTEPVPVVVLNTAQEAPLTYDPASRVYVPPDWQTAEFDVRSMADNPGGVKRVLSWLTWDKSAAMRMEYAIGMGLCPHRGTKMLAAESTEGEIVLDLRRSELTSDVLAKLQTLTSNLPADVFPVNTDPLTFGIFFGHIAIMDAADHVGDTVPVQMHTVLFK